MGRMRGQQAYIGGLLASLDCPQCHCPLPVQHLEDMKKAAREADCGCFKEKLHYKKKTSDCTCSIVYIRW